MIIACSIGVSLGGAGASQMHSGIPHLHSDTAGCAGFSALTLGLVSVTLPMSNLETESVTAFTELGEADTGMVSLFNLLEEYKTELDIRKSPREKRRKPHNCNNIWKQNDQNKAIRNILWDVQAPVNSETRKQWQTCVIGKHGYKYIYSLRPKVIYSFTFLCCLKYYFQFQKQQVFNCNQFKLQLLYSFTSQHIIHLQF